jgi:ketosteroid isomerase-like protein
MIPTDKNCQDHLRPMKRPRNEMQEMTDLIYTYAEDVANIEDLRRRDVAASIAGEFENLKSLMDEQCIVLAPDSEPESGQAFLDRAADSSKDAKSQEQILELIQDWEELQLFGDFAYERGIVRYTVRNVDGEIVRETQRLMRILRRQDDGSWRVYRAMWHRPQEAR